MELVIKVPPLQPHLQVSINTLETYDSRLACARRRCPVTRSHRSAHAEVCVGQRRAYG